MYGSSTRIASAGRTQPTIVVELFMAGDIGHAKQVVRRFCMDVPSCVTVTPTTFVYKGGEEEGFFIGFRNYPRFPSTAEELRGKAESLAERLRGELAQRSYMIVEAGGATAWNIVPTSDKEGQ